MPQIENVRAMARSLQLGEVSARKIAHDALERARASENVFIQIDESVLETAEQYTRHGLTPVDPTSTPDVPVVPEPSIWWLGALAGLIGMWRRRR